MRISSSVVLLASCFSFVSADCLSDLAVITDLVDTVSTDIALSLFIPTIPSNATASTPVYTRPVGLVYNTSMAVENITSAVMASTTNYNSNLTAFINSQNETMTDNAYSLYINAVPTLAQALIARGRALHQEDNLPVYECMGNLSQAIFTYGQGLTSRNIVSTLLTIRTITASGDIVSGQEAWSAPGFLPGL